MNCKACGTAQTRLLNSKCVMQNLRLRRHRFVASLLRASLHLRRHRFDLQPLLHSTSRRSRRPLQSLNLQPTTLDLQPDACLKPLLTLLGPPLDQQPLQPLLAFLGPTLNQQPLPPPTQLWLQDWRRCTFLGATLNQQPLPPPTQLWLQSWRR